MPDVEEDIVRPNSGRTFLPRRSFVWFPDLSTQLIFWFVALIGLALDLWTKNALVGNSYNDRLGLNLIRGPNKYSWG